MVVLKEAKDKLNEDMWDYHDSFPNRPKLTDEKCYPHHMMPLESIEKAGGMDKIYKRRLEACKDVESYLSQCKRTGQNLGEHNDCHD